MLVQSVELQKGVLQLRKVKDVREKRDKLNSFKGN